MSVNKQGIWTTPAKTISNLYTGKQYNYSFGTLTYDYETDIFKDYGFNTALKWTATSRTDQFMAYSYLINASIQYELGQEYVVSLYAYVSEDCNANFRLNLEHSNTWVSNYQGTNSNINDATKGKVIWVWGRCKASTTDGRIYIMFYPNPNQTNVFTSGYQLFTGITVYKGNEVLRPMNNSVSGSGFIESLSTPPRKFSISPHRKRLYFSRRNIRNLNCRKVVI